MKRAQVLLLLLTLGACTSGGDPDRDLVGGGEIAKGFEFRFDKPESKRDSIRLVRNEQGLLAETGPNVILWRPQDTAKGRFTLSAEVRHLDSFGHPHGAGLLFGGSQLAEANQAYTYFLVHDDGQFLIKTRKGETTAYLCTWTEHTAVLGKDEKGIAKNRLTIEVDEKETRFLINDTEVHKTQTSAIATDGLYGLRMVHNLRVQFSEPKLQPKS